MLLLLVLKDREVKHNEESIWPKILTLQFPDADFGDGLEKVDDVKENGSEQNEGCIEEDA